MISLKKRKINVFLDTDWAGSIDDTRFTTAYCIFVWGDLIIWRSKKQYIVARSSVELEYQATVQGICEELWLKKLLEELQVKAKIPLKVNCDNKTIINISLNSV